MQLNKTKQNQKTQTETKSSKIKSNQTKYISIYLLFRTRLGSFIYFYDKKKAKGWKEKSSHVKSCKTLTITCFAYHGDETKQQVTKRCKYVEKSLLSQKGWEAACGSLQGLWSAGCN